MSNKKNKKRNSKAFDNFKLGASSIISNNSVVELARSKPWYGAVIAGLISVVLTVIPTLVSGMRAKGSSIIASPTYNLDIGIAEFQKDLCEQKTTYPVDFSLTEGKLSANETAWHAFALNNGGTEDKPWYVHTNSSSGKVDFQVMYVDYAGSTWTKFIKKAVSGKNPYYTIPAASPLVGHPHREDESEAEKKVFTLSNLLILGRKEFRIFKCNAKGKLVSGGTAINWQYKGKLPFYASESLIPTSTDPVEKANQQEKYVASVKSKWSTFLNLGYEDYRNKMAWSSVGIMAAIFSGFTIFMGFILWIMCRGKNNPFRIYNLWHTQKMAYWAAPTPALLSMILGFFLNGGILSYVYIFLFGMRIMWMSMKQLRPAAR